MLAALPVPLSLAETCRMPLGVNVEGYFDLRHAARCGCDVAQVELTQRFVGGSAFAFALQYMDGYCAFGCLRR